MIRAAVVAVALLLAFSIVWLIVVPVFDIFIAAVEPYVKNSGAAGVVENVRVYIGNALVWVGVLFFVMVIVWLIVYAFRREVDTYAEYQK
ncbi:MAG: hypothetical protein QW512_03360 [Thermofilaceae archaeon]